MDSRSSAAMACSMRPSTDKAELEQVLALACTAVQLERNVSTLLTLGIAEYRCGQFRGRRQGTARRGGDRLKQLAGSEHRGDLPSDEPVSAKKHRRGSHDRHHG